MNEFDAASGPHGLLKRPCGMRVISAAVAGVASSKDLIAAYMTRMGAPQQMINMQPKTESHLMKYVDYEQAKAWVLLNPRP